jgi:hypothetical protein
MLAKSLEGDKGIKSVAVFNTPVGAGAAGRSLQAQFMRSRYPQRREIG